MGIKTGGKSMRTEVIDSKIIVSGNDTLEVSLIEESFKLIEESELKERKQRALKIEMNIDGEEHSQTVYSSRQNIYGVDLMKEFPADEARLLNSIMAMYIVANISREFPIYTPINLLQKFQKFIDKINSNDKKNF